MSRAGTRVERRGGRAFSPELAGTLRRVQRLLATCGPDLRRWLALNLALLTVAMLQLWRGARSGHGSLTLGALSRALPLEEGEKARSKRLARLLRNQYLIGSALTPLLVRLALGPRPRGWVPIVLDQTLLRGTPTLLAGVRVAGRILPVAFACFEYRTLRKSQNALEWALLLLVTASLPPGCTPLFVLDRGYARVALLAQLRQAGIPYLVRGRRNTMVRLGGQRLALGRVPHQQGVAVRYPRVLYQSTTREPVDLIIFHDPTFKEPWYLLVPPGSRRQLPTATVVALYRQRMHIELTFRDWKTHLGIRGLRLEVDIAPRLERLLLALTVAYIFAVLLGAGPAARSVRADCEVLRTTPRHGTRRRLSALTVGILLLSLTRFAALAARALTRLLAALARGRPAITLAVCPP
ncbi:MAG TPA: transposase [Candidatus Methylomirabilis sp.]|jgi:hypothetical protein